MARKTSIHIPEYDIKVNGLINKPRQAFALLVLGHGAGAGMEHPFMEGLAEQLAKGGLACLRYNFPYMDQGKKAPGSAKLSLATVAAAFTKGLQLAGDLPCFVGGKSYGGRMSSLAAAEARLEGNAGMIYFGFPLHAPGKHSTDRAAHLKDIKVPMLFLQGTRDTLARQDLIESVCQPLKKTDLEIFEGADHSFKVLKRSGMTNEAVFEDLVQRSLAWAKRKSS